MSSAVPDPRGVVTVPVQGGAAAGGYDACVGSGLLDELPGRVAAAAPAARYAVVVPDDISRSYGDRVLSGLHAAGMDAALLEFPAGERHKTRETWAALSDLMLELRFGRDSCVIALGGGVAGDLAGFVAATYMRGVPVVQVPTTLLAMIDASVGGKTGVDTGAGKNLIGAFHPPSLVLADTDTLRTLPPQQFRSGLAEAVKHGAILDGAYFHWIEAHASAILDLDPDALHGLVSRSIELKAGVVADDPHEHGMRATLNFGHTVGHALEQRAGYTLLHGLAVGLGMLAEARAGEWAGITAPGTSDRIRELLLRLGLPTAAGVAVPGGLDAPGGAPSPAGMAAAAAVEADALLEAMVIDKKARGARPHFALPARIGEAVRHGGGWTCVLPGDVVKSAIAALFQEDTVV